MRTMAGAIEEIVLVIKSKGDRLQMSRIRVSLMSLLAVFAFSAVAVSAAQAAGGPEWETHDGVLAKKIVSKNVGTLKLKTTTATIECKTEENTGEILAGNPGQDTATITFKECSVEGKTVAECAATSAGEAAGVVKFAVKTLLVYPEGKKESTTEADDAFFPGTAGSNLFVEFELKGTNCGTLNNKKVKVNATGTEVKEPAYNNKCGALAEVGRVNNRNEFERTWSGELVYHGGLNLPTPAIKKGELWEPTPKTWKVIECKLEAFSEAAEEIGLVKVVIEGEAEAFGWEV